MSALIPRRCRAHRRACLLACRPAILQHRNSHAPLGAHQWRAAHKQVQPRRGEARPPENTLLNPPASTRPPPLDVPPRSASDSTAQYLFQLGKGYLKFYKDGLKAVLANRRLLKEKLERTPADDRPSVLRPHYVPKTFSRADWVLLWRVRHDMLRLPLFGLMLLVIGEFTALVVIYVDGVVPYTCRIPKQLYSGLQKAEGRRRLAFDELEARYPHGVLSPQISAPVARKHVLRSLHLSGMMWDRLGFTPPGMWQVKGRLRMAFLEGDDKNLIEDGGPMGLETEELRIACAERGIDVMGRSETELRSWLGDWLRLTAAEDVSERRRRMTTLLLTRPEHWPQQRNFAVPDWEL
ncbi:LETM1-like protein [Metarhizium album ARSEF 1941]|uniref:LETM1-like protein n=1 Tax=Metarhizium album (strain ARSEF 1941) TaxID=1081103 RepID=A0A0B2WLJ6_METAS|nr:LETM1-like protein [Metarhizium album ARSEF 1941]KHN96936.1 LETM1-like protein [Metarhizium album ARSEF 1941]